MRTAERSSAVWGTSAIQLVSECLGSRVGCPALNARHGAETMERVFVGLDTGLALRGLAALLSVVHREPSALHAFCIFTRLHCPSPLEQSKKEKKKKHKKEKGSKRITEKKAMEETRERQERQRGRRDS